MTALHANTYVPARLTDHGTARLRTRGPIGTKTIEAPLLLPAGADLGLASTFAGATARETSDTV
jgi:hypothetical protein